MKINQSALISSEIAKKADGKKIAKLEQDLANLDKYENTVKNGMQDRLKFMSGKNACRKNKELDIIERRRLVLQTEIARLQERV
jgi:hypothetical protein